jgi:hypothetical protein
VRDGAHSLQEQIYTEIRRLILSGRLATRERLPSSREMARDLGVSRNTVLYARLLPKTKLIVVFGALTRVRSAFALASVRSSLFTIMARILVAVLEAVRTLIWTRDFESGLTMRVRPISFLSAISVVALFLIAPSHRGNAELAQSTQEGPSTAPIDMADTTKRIAQLAQGSDYNAAIELAGQLAEAVKARLGAHHADYARILYNLADLLTAAGRRVEAVARYREAIAIFEELAAADPSDFEWPRYLIGAHERIIKAGGEPGAHTEKALAIVNRLRSQGRLEPWEMDWPAELELKLRGIALDKLVGAGKFADALTMGERRAKQVQLSAAAKGTALTLAPDRIWLATNYAHALLFLGRRAAAKAVYLRYKGENVPDRGKWEAVHRCRLR